MTKTYIEWNVSIQCWDKRIGADVTTDITVNAFTATTAIARALYVTKVNKPSIKKISVYLR